MRLLKVIDEARKQGIMPVLCEDVTLRVTHHEVSMIMISPVSGKLISKRKLYNIVKDCEVELCASLLSAKNETYSNQLNNWNNFIEMKDKTSEIIQQTKIGEGPELYVYTQSYVNPEGKQCQLTENRTRIVSLFEPKVITTTRTVLAFEGDE